MSTALFFMLAGFILGFVLREALIRAEVRPPRPSARRPGPSLSSSGAPRAGAHSNCRVIPRDPTAEYAARYLDECREVGQDEVIRRRGL